MREYSKKSESQSRTLDSNPKASRQAPFDVILQRYKQNLQLYVSAKEEKPIQTSAGKVVQMMKVNVSDIGKTYQIRLSDNSIVQGVLTSFSGSGWYHFDVGGKDVAIRGETNILQEIVSTPAPLSSILRTYDVHALSTSVSEFVVNEIAQKYNISPQDALQMIADSFGRDPRTIRIHYPFGLKTVSKGIPAFSTPSETKQLPQAMVSYRVKDYPKHEKVGKDYDDWADELSDSEDSESQRRSFSKRSWEYLTQISPTDDFSDLPPRKRAALGGIITATQISDRLRTSHDSPITPMDFSERLRKRSQGEGSMHSIFGSKTSSTFFPARKGGSKQQRSQLSLYEQEIAATPLLHSNNCLIHAICLAAYGRVATDLELLIIRSTVGNVGEMLTATDATINEIRRVLRISAMIVVRYPLGSGAMNEVFTGSSGVILNIFHTNGNHFQHTQPTGTQYDLS